MRLPDRDDTARRTFLGTLVAGVAAGTAGCIGGSDDDGADDAGDDRDHDHDDHAEHDDQGGTGDADAALADHPGDGPIDPPSDRRCDGVCGMVVEEYPEWDAQVAHADETGAFFCSAGCMVGYYIDPPALDGSEAAVVSVWVSAFDDGVLIDGTEASYVLDDDFERMDEPMGLNPRPFADREDAVAWAEETDGLSADDVAGLEAFDFELADMYRPGRVPE